MRRSAIFHAFFNVSRISDHLYFAACSLDLFLGGSGELVRLNRQLLGDFAVAHDLHTIKDVLGDADAPTSKAKPEELKALFEKALPTYDRDRFYVSHMKKVVDWYNVLKNHASLDFVEPESEDAEA